MQAVPGQVQKLGGGLQERYIMQLNLQMHVPEGWCMSQSMCKLSLDVTPPMPSLSSHDQEARCPCTTVQMVCILPSALLSPCFAAHSTLLLPLTCLLTEERGTFRHMDLPFVYQQQDKGHDRCGDWPLIGCGSSTIIWLALTCRGVGRGYGLKLGGDSWLLKQCL